MDASSRPITPIFDTPPLRVFARCEKFTIPERRWTEERIAGPIVPVTADLKMSFFLPDLVSMV